MEILEMKMNQFSTKYSTLNESKLK